MPWSNGRSRKGRKWRLSTTELGWLALLAPRLALPLSALLGGLLLHSMKGAQAVLRLSTVSCRVSACIGGSAGFSA
jgi:hypothetical protein